jgi:RNA polymerase sigma-70 factor (ECF subfamily)
MACVASIRERYKPFENGELMATPRTDEGLVAAAQSGDHAAFVELWARHSNTAFKTAYRIMRNQDDAEDAIQEAWMKAYVHLNTFDGRAKFSTWLTRITINSALMTLRRRRTRPETSMEVYDDQVRRSHDIEDRTKDTEELFVRQERAEHLRLAIGRLRPNLRSVVEIHQLNDGSVKELAELAGISIAAVKSRLLRARKALRKTMECKNKAFMLRGSTRIEQSASQGAVTPPQTKTGYRMSNL